MKAVSLKWCGFSAATVCECRFTLPATKNVCSDF